MSKWIKKDDKVVVIAGNDKGRTGTVLSRTEERIVLQGINIRKRHLKRRSQAAGPTIVEKEMPIHISNVSLCNADGKPVKVRVRTGAKGVKELFYIDGGKEVVHRKLT
jgi:large subunit ribosomal protein L24